MKTFSLSYLFYVINTQKTVYSLRQFRCYPLGFPKLNPTAIIKTIAMIVVGNVI